MKIAKGTLKSHQMCVIRDSKYVTKGIKCYNSGSLQQNRPKQEINQPNPAGSLLCVCWLLKSFDMVNWNETPPGGMLANCQISTKVVLWHDGKIKVECKTWNSCGLFCQECTSTFHSHLWIFGHILCRCSNWVCSIPKFWQHHHHFQWPWQSWTLCSYTQADSRQRLQSSYNGRFLPLSCLILTLL